MILGALIPQASNLSFLVQYLLIVMLFLAFLDIEINPRSFQKGIVWVFLANVGIAFGAYMVLASRSSELALAAFMTAIAPSAIASTVIVGFIHGRVDFMVAAVLVTNIGIALVVPLALPVLLGESASISTLDVLQPVLITMFVPLILARLAGRLPHRSLSVIRAGKRFAFPIWVLNLFIISAKASDFIRYKNSGSLSMLAQIALISLVLCVINFVAGALLGGRKYRLETSQALGQKNNSFAIWIALTFMNPLVAMGPTFYILYHNLFNTWQIYRFVRQQNKPGLTTDETKRIQDAKIILP